MIKILKRTVKDKKFKELKNFDLATWVYIESPSEKERKRIVKEFFLDRGLIADALDPYEVPRLEIENGDIYIFTRIPYIDKHRPSTTPFLIVFRKDSVITIAQKTLPFLNKLIGPEKEIYTTQKARLVLQIFNEINTQYNSFLMSISRSVRSVSVDIENIDNKDIIRFLRYENTLNDFLGALVPMNTILENILSGKFLKLYEKDGDLVEDLSLANTQLIELAGSTMKNIVNIREVYSTIMSNNLNKVMKLLTSLTVILTIPTIVSSIYGMNIKLPLATHPLAFIWVLIGALLSSIIVLYVFIKKQWM